MSGEESKAQHTQKLTALKVELKSDPELLCALQGTLIKHLEEHVLQGNMTRDDVLLYYTTVT